MKGIGLIDTRKIGNITDGEGSESYLGDKVESENIYAKRYARFVMRDVVCCDSSDTLEQFSKSVTKDRLRFQNFCLQRMRKKEHFIGVDAIEKQLKLAKSSMQEVGRYNSIFRLQMPAITPHVCRHTYCSNQAKAGMNPKTLQYLMGHSDIGVTLNTYIHLGLEDAAEEMKRMEAVEKEKPMKQNMFKVA